MYRLRVVEGLTLRELGERFGIGPERVRQLLNRRVRQTTGLPVDAKAMSRAATAARRAKDLALAQARAEELLAAWRTGEKLEEIASRFGLRCRSVAQVLAAQKTDADSAARARALRRLRRPPG
jgi:3-hydroxyisobutyrate dehydrogenase-like beta-hydroxyacid dehydrogenase